MHARKSVSVHHSGGWSVRARPYVCVSVCTHRRGCSTRTRALHASARKHTRPRARIWPVDSQRKAMEKALLRWSWRPREKGGQALPERMLPVSGRRSGVSNGSYMASCRLLSKANVSTSQSYHTHASRTHTSTQTRTHAHAHAHPPALSPTHTYTC